LQEESSRNYNIQPYLSFIDTSSASKLSMKTSIRLDQLVNEVFGVGSKSAFLNILKLDEINPEKISYGNIDSSASILSKKKSKIDKLTKYLIQVVESLFVEKPLIYDSKEAYFQLLRLIIDNLSSTLEIMIDQICNSAGIIKSKIKQIQESSENDPIKDENMAILDLFPQYIKAISRRFCWEVVLYVIILGTGVH